VLLFPLLLAEMETVVVVVVVVADVVVAAVSGGEEPKSRSNGEKLACLGA